MPEVRMSLAEASTVLGIAANSVRSRYKAGKIRGERDNEGRIWVWVDPNVTPSKPPSKTAVSKSSIEGSKLAQIEALQAHISTLKEQLSGANDELATLRPKAAERDRLEAEAAGLRAQLDILKSDREEWRRMAQSRRGPRGGGFFNIFRPRYND